jgi:hypothetical protein
MTVTGESWSDTINSLRGVRTLVDPNFAFQRQLKHFNDKLRLQVYVNEFINISSTNEKPILGT